MRKARQSFVSCSFRSYQCEDQPSLFALMYKYRNLSSNKNSDPANNLVGGWASTSRSLVATEYLKIWPRKPCHHHQNPHHTQKQISENLTAKVPSVKQEGEQGGGRQQCRNKNGAKTRWCDGIMSSDFLKMETFCHVTKNATCAKDKVEGNSKANMCVNTHAHDTVDLWCIKVTKTNTMILISM